MDILKTKRWWTVTMQLVMAVGLALVAFTIPIVPTAQIAAGNVPVSLFTACLAIFWLVAFSSATHDIAADGALHGLWILLTNLCLWESAVRSTGAPQFSGRECLW